MGRPFRAFRPFCGQLSQPSHREHRVITERTETDFSAARDDTLSVLRFASVFSVTKSGTLDSASAIHRGMKPLLQFQQFGFRIRA